MPEIDLARLTAEDQVLDTIGDIPWRFGENIPVNLDPDNSGKWHILENGDRLWRLGIYSPGAHSLNLTFDHYRLPPGAALHIYSADRTTVLGAFTEVNNQDDLHFATTLIPGDRIILEYLEPARAEFAGRLRLGTVTHAYRDVFGHLKSFGQSGYCNLNTACEEALPWQQQVNSAVMLVVGGNGFCSGVLVNNTGFDQTPYVLSANHCLRNPATVVFWFNWQSDTCPNPSASPSYQSLSGAVTRARSSGSDFWLLELNHRIPESYNPFFAGWNRSLNDSLDEMIIGVHHPRGDIKKFSYALDGVQASAYLGDPLSGVSHWRIVWSGGTTTEPGSSGSAIFDAQGRIIGQLHGGYAACGNTEPDWYGRFGVSWDGGGSSSSRLSTWLDPLNLSPTSINGLDPSSSSAGLPPTLALENQFADNESDTCHNALLTITTGGEGHFTVEAGAVVSLIAGGNIIMKPGTHFMEGSQVHAYISTNGVFCGDPGKHLLTAERTEPVSSPEIAKPGGDGFFRVFPNPTAGRFTLALDAFDTDNEVVVEVYGMAGNRIISTRLQPDSEHTLSLEGQKAGIYLIRVIQGNRVGTERLIMR